MKNVCGREAKSNKSKAFHQSLEEPFCLQPGNEFPSTDNFLFEFFYFFPLGETNFSRVCLLKIDGPFFIYL